MPTGSDERAAADTLFPFDLPVSEIKTTQLASSDIAVYAIPVAPHEHGARELAAQTLVAPNLSYLARAHLQQSAASAIARGDENLSPKTLVSAR